MSSGRQGTSASVSVSASSSVNSKDSSSRKLSLRMDKEVLEAFNIFDRDQDGRVSRNEIIELIDKLGGDPTCPHLQDLLFAADKSEGKSLDVAHFMVLWNQFKSKVLDEDDQTEEEIKLAFQDYDVNGDGYITKDEMMQAMAKMGFVSNKEEEAIKCLNEMDLDGDGRVSYAEFMVKWRVT